MTISVYSQDWVLSTSLKYREDSCPDDVTDCRIILNNNDRLRSTIYGIIMFEWSAAPNGLVKSTAEKGLKGPRYLDKSNGPDKINIVLDEGAKVKVISSDPNDFIDLTRYHIRPFTNKKGFFVNSGKIQIIKGQPKFIRNGLLLLNNFFKTDFKNIDLPVSIIVWRNSKGEYKREYKFVIEKKQIGLNGLIELNNEKIHCELKEIDGIASIVCIRRNSII